MPFDWLVDKLKKHYGLDEYQEQLSKEEQRLKKWAKTLKEQSEEIKELNPIKRLEKLEDNTNKCYVWILNDDEPDHACWELMSFINSEYIKLYGHEPLSLHIVVKDVDEIKTLNSKQLKKYLKPWMED